MHGPCGGEKGFKGKRRQSGKEFALRGSGWGGRHSPAPETLVGARNSSALTDPCEEETGCRKGAPSEGGVCPALWESNGAWFPHKSLKSLPD